MINFIEACLHKRKTVIFLLLFCLITGTLSYINIPKESRPDIKVPIIYISLHLQGIAPKDAERLLVKPIENKVRSIEGVKEMTSSAYEHGGFVLLEFNAGVDIDQAKMDVKDQVDLAKPDLPRNADEPTIHEVNLSLFPVLVLKLSGDIPARSLYKAAADLKDAIESHVSQVLTADIVGDREEIIEIIVDPVKIHGHSLSYTDVIQFFNSNHLVITAGNLRVGDGQFSLNVPGLLENVQDIMELPIVSNDKKVLKFKEIAEIRRTYRAPDKIARDRGKPAVAIEISKRTGENIIETVEGVRKVVAELKPHLPAGLIIDFSQDESNRIRDMLKDLQNSIILAVFLVMVIIVMALGGRSALLVGIAVPGSFLIAMMVIAAMGLTVNIIVLFSLILSVGMLVDGAIIVVEYADRLMLNGENRYQAYLNASKRMLWPVVSSIATILVVFLPLLAWPGIVGKFMRFMPITLLATLTASLVMALIFIPVLGSYWGKATLNPQAHAAVQQTENGNLQELQGFTGWYVRLLDRALDYPGYVLGGVVALLAGVVLLYVTLGRGVEFFPQIEPDMAIVRINARGNLSPNDMSNLVKDIENKLLDMPELKSVYSTSGKIAMGSAKASNDLIGRITLELVDWQQRRKANVILDEVRQRIGDAPGLGIEVVAEKKGPSADKPIELEVVAYDLDQLHATTQKLRKIMSSMPGLINLEDNESIPSLEWKIEINRAEAAKYNLSADTIGMAISLLGDQGVKLGELRPDDSREEIDVVVRYPESKRTWRWLKDIRVINREGRSIPLALVTKITPHPKLSIINRSDGRRAVKLKADVAPGVLAADKLKELRAVVAQLPATDAQVLFKGEEGDRLEAQAFLIKAFAIAIFLITFILLIQFDSFFSVGLVLSAVVLSLIGVFIGLLINHMAFGVVMGGIGIISLAGIIVSNNIILIDTFDILKHKHQDIREVILRTGAQRLRPVILTKLTTILGLLPIMLRIDIDFLGPAIHYDSPSSQWWVQLSTTIVYGVLFASILTLIVTPCALMLREKRLIAKPATE